MLSLDPLTEEAAFLAAAVNEGSLSANSLMRLVEQRAKMMTPPYPLDLDVVHARARVVDAALARGVRLTLAGVPFIAGVGMEAQAVAIEHAGAIRLRRTAQFPPDAKETGAAVADGLAAFALARKPEHQAGAAGVHVLRPAGRHYAVLARSCRDLALATDAVEAHAAAGDLLCCSLTEMVGRGAGSLSIAVVAPHCLAVTQQAVQCSVGSRPVDVVEQLTLALSDLQRFDAIVANAAQVPLADWRAQLWLAWSRSGPCCIVASRTDVAIRIGACFDAMQLVGS